MDISKLNINDSFIVNFNEESDDELKCPPEFVINEIMTSKFASDTDMSLEQIKVHMDDVEYILSFKFQIVSH